MPRWRTAPAMAAHRLRRMAPPVECASRSWRRPILRLRRSPRFARMAPRCNSSRDRARSPSKRRSGSPARSSISSHNWQPFFLQGTKSIAYEIWEDLDFQAPDNVIVPVGAGSNLLGCHIGFSELLAAGQIQKLPRLFAAQPFNCSPVDASFQAGVDTPVQRAVHKTIAEGTAIAHPLRLREMIHALRESGGETVAVSEEG